MLNSLMACVNCVLRILTKKRQVVLQIEKLCNILYMLQSFFLLIESKLQTLCDFEMSISRSAVKQAKQPI